MYAFLWETEEHPQRIQEHSENCLLYHMHNLVGFCNQRRKKKMLILSDTLPQNMGPLGERGFVLISIKRFLIASFGEDKPSAQPPLLLAVTFCSPQRLPGCMSSAANSPAPAKKWGWASGGLPVRLGESFHSG